MAKPTNRDLHVLFADYLDAKTRGGQSVCEAAPPPVSSGWLTLAVVAAVIYLAYTLYGVWWRYQAERRRALDNAESDLHRRAAEAKRAVDTAAVPEAPRRARAPQMALAVAEELSTSDNEAAGWASDVEEIDFHLLLQSSDDTQREKN